MKSYKILIVDDAPFIREILISYFENQASGTFEVFEAENGLKGVEAFKSFHPDLIFMDIVMPELSGIEATKEIRKLNKSVPIIGLSTLNDSPIINKLLDAGANHFVKKPFAVEDLNQALKEHLS